MGCITSDIKAFLSSINKADGDGDSVDDLLNFFKNTKNESGLKWHGIYNKFSPCGKDFPNNLKKLLEFLVNANNAIPNRERLEIPYDLFDAKTIVGILKSTKFQMSSSTKEDKIVAYKKLTAFFKSLYNTYNNPLSCDELFFLLFLIGKNLEGKNSVSKSEFNGIVSDFKKIFRPKLENIFRDKKSFQTDDQLASNFVWFCLYSKLVKQPITPPEQLMKTGAFDEKQCPYCGETISKNEQKCPYCEIEFKNPVCPHCEAKLGKSGTSCPECGLHFAEFVQFKTIKSEAEDKFKNGDFESALRCCDILIRLSPKKHNDVDSLVKILSTAIANRTEKEKIESEKKANRERLEEQKRRQQEKDLAGLPAPKKFTAEPKGYGIKLSWDEYKNTKASVLVLMRGENTHPTSNENGKIITKLPISENEFFDVDVSGGTICTYSIYPSIGGRISPNGAKVSVHYAPPPTALNFRITSLKELDLDFRTAWKISSKYKEKVNPFLTISYADGILRDEDIGGGVESFSGKIKFNPKKAVNSTKISVSLRFKYIFLDGSCVFSLPQTLLLSASERKPSLNPLENVRAERISPNTVHISWTIPEGAQKGALISNSTTPEESETSEQSKTNENSFDISTDSLGNLPRYYFFKAFNSTEASKPITVQIYPRKIDLKCKVKRRLFLFGKYLTIYPSDKTVSLPEMEIYTAKELMTSKRDGILFKSVQRQKGNILIDVSGIKNSYIRIFFKNPCDSCNFTPPISVKV